MTSEYQSSSRVRQDAGTCGTAYSDRLALVSRWARDHLDVSSVTGASVSESAPNTARPPLIPRPPLIGRPPFIAKPPPAGAEEVVLTPTRARINSGAHGRQVEQAPIKSHSTDRRDCIATAPVPLTTPAAPPPASVISTPRKRQYVQEDVMQEHVMQQHHARHQEERESIHAAPDHKQTSHQVAGKSTCHRFSARTLSHVPPHWLTILVARVLSHDAMTFVRTGTLAAYLAAHARKKAETRCHNSASQSDMRAPPAAANGPQFFPPPIFRTRSRKNPAACGPNYLREQVFDPTPYTC